MVNEVDRITELHLRNEVQFFVFQLDDSKDKFAVNIFKVKEVIKYNGKIVDIFYPIPYFEGVIDVRGLSIPVVDLRKWFYYKGKITNLDPYGVKLDDYVVLICEFSGILVGIRIYRANGIMTKSWEDFVRDDNDGEHKKVIGYIKGEEIIQVVDIEKMAVEAFPFIEEEKIKQMKLVDEISSDKTVLIADDSKPVLKMMSKIMEALKVKYMLFKNGEELLNYLFSHPKDDILMIITDLEMPKVSGFEVIKQVKNSEYKDIPIIVNSTMSGESNEEMAKSLNAEGFISKTNPKEIEFFIKKYI